MTKRHLEKINMATSLEGKMEDMTGDCILIL